MKSVRVSGSYLSTWKTPGVLLCPNICSQGNILYCTTLMVLKDSFQIYWEHSFILRYSQLIIFLMKIKLLITDLLVKWGKPPIPDQFLFPAENHETFKI